VSTSSRSWNGVQPLSKPAPWVPVRARAVDVQDLPTYHRAEPDAATDTIGLGDAARVVVRGFADLAARRSGRADAAAGGPAPFTGPRLAGIALSSLSVGWPHRRSTVVRVAHSPCPVVVGALTGRRRWGAMELVRWIDEAEPFDVALSAHGRLHIPWSVAPVRVHLRVTPFQGACTLLELVLMSRGRYPRRYWHVGHDAISAVVDAVTDRVGGSALA